jgi:hypothetical protein
MAKKWVRQYLVGSAADVPEVLLISRHAEKTCKHSFDALTAPYWLLQYCSAPARALP